MVLLALVLWVGGLLTWTIERGRPVSLPATVTSLLPCVSYAPFRRSGHSPFDASLIVTPAQIEADLRVLQQVTGCVRTYGVDHGLDALPAIARRLGLRVVLGAWIGRDRAANQWQLERALALSREFADVVDLLVVGNEVLLRRELTPQALTELLAQAQRRSAVPVSYADVWEFWLRHGEALRDHVDVVSAHVLPYWEDEPVAVGDAVKHVRHVADRLRKTFAPLPIFIAETGWPANGRQRGPAIPGVVEQTRFVRELQAIAERSEISAGVPAFNLIEGFDQPWKRELEGAMGGYWGLFDAAARQRVSLGGPVRPAADWIELPLAGLIGAVMGLAFCMGRAHWRFRRRDVTRLLRQRIEAAVVWLLAGAAVGVAAVWQWQMLASWSRSPSEWLLGGLAAAVALCCAILAADRVAGHVEATAAVPTRPGVVAAWSQPAHAGQRGLAGLRIALLFVTAIAALGLVFDSRYRPLLWPAVWPAAVLLLAAAWLGDRLASDAREERALAGILAVAAPLVLWQEGWRNGQAWLAVAPWLMLAAASWWPHGAMPRSLVDPRGHGRTNTSTASSTAGAAQVRE